MPKAKILKKAALGTAIVGALSLITSLLKIEHEVDQSKTGATSVEKENSIEEKLSLLIAEINELLSSARYELKTIAGNEQARIMTWIENAEKTRTKLEHLLNNLETSSTSNKAVKVAVKESKKVISEAKKYLLKISK